MAGLSGGESNSTIRLAVLTQYQGDRQTDGQTDGRTDGRGCLSISCCKVMNERGSAVATEEDFVFLDCNLYFLTSFASQ